MHLWKSELPITRERSLWECHVLASQVPATWHENGGSAPAREWGEPGRDVLLEQLGGREVCSTRAQERVVRIYEGA